MDKRHKSIHGHVDSCTIYLLPCFYSILLRCFHEIKAPFVTVFLLIINLAMIWVFCCTKHLLGFYSSVLCHKLVVYGLYALTLYIWDNNYGIIIIIMMVFAHMQNWAARWPCFDLLYTAKFNNNNDNGIRTSLEILDEQKHLVHAYWTFLLSSSGTLSKVRLILFSCVLYLCIVS